MSLARGGAVSLDAQGEASELTARVAVAGSPLAPTVRLYADDEEWECDCPSPLEACEHVAAAVIAERQGLGASPKGRPLEYRLRRTPEGFHFERGVTADGTFHAVDVRLDALAAGRFRGPAVAATPEDLEVEAALGGVRSGLLPTSALPRVFQALSKVSVSLDGEPVRVSGTPRPALVVVEDATAPDGGHGFRVRLDRGAPERGELRPDADVPLSGREYRDLTEGRVYGESEVGELVGTILPGLEGRARVDVRSRRLPGASRERPVPSLRLERSGDGLYVLPRVAYGDPPVAFVEDDRLVAEGDRVPRRDPEGEAAAAARLRQELGLEPGRGQALRAEEAVELVRSLPRWTGVVEGDGRERFRMHAELVPSFEVDEEDFRVGFGGASPRAVLAAWRSGASHVALDSGGFAPLPLDWLDRFGDPLEDLLAARDATRGLSRAALPELAGLARDLGAETPESWKELEALVRGFESVPDAPIAPALWDVLRDYQKQGVSWLWFAKRAGFGALLADDMGLGKTLQALCTLDGPSLIAAPTSVLANWRDELRRFRPELSVNLYHGPDRALDDREVTVTSHALLRLDAERLAGRRYAVFVLDEAQAIKNPETGLAKAAFSIDAGFRVSLTGTPVENRLDELWSQMRLLNPGLLGSRSDFEERYVRPAASGRPEPLERLRRRLRPFVLRRLKREVAPELPPRTELTLRAELQESERRVYDAVRLAVRKDVAAALGRKTGTLEALEALLRLRQAACHPALVPGQRAESSSKTELLFGQLELAAAEGHKSLVFSQWTAMLDLLEPGLRDRGLDFVRLDGSTRDREAVVSRFRDDETVSTFLISLKAGGTGLNLTAADHVFLFEPWWNPAVEEQAFDRAHRIGQTRPVFVHRLVAADTVEDRMLKLQADKRALAEGALGAPASPLTREDLLGLLD